jgi:hypothetical protein
VAALALNWSCLLPDFSFGQVTALALAVKSFLYVDKAPFGEQLMAFLALWRRLPFPPDIAPLLIIVVALFASYGRFGVTLMAEPHRGLFRTGLLDF